MGAASSQIASPGKAEPKRTRSSDKDDDSARKRKKDETEASEASEASEATTAAAEAAAAAASSSAAATASSSSAAATASSSSSAATATASAPGSANRPSRRKSVGRNERRSVVDLQINADDLTDFHKDIKESDPVPLRLKALVDAAFKHSFREVEEKGVEGIRDIKTHIEALRAELMELISDELLQGACAVPKLKTNPKNTDMEENLVRYQNAQDRLEKEEKLWKEWALRIAAPVPLPNAAEAEALLEKDQVAVLDAAQVEEAPTDNVSFKLQVEQLESFVKLLHRIESKGENFYSSVAKSIGEAAFSQYQHIDDPKALLRAVTAAKQ